MELEGLGPSQRPAHRVPLPPPVPTYPTSPPIKFLLPPLPCGGGIFMWNSSTTSRASPHLSLYQPHPSQACLCSPHFPLWGINLALKYAHISRNLPQYFTSTITHNIRISDHCSICAQVLTWQVNFQHLTSALEFTWTHSLSTLSTHISLSTHLLACGINSNT